MLASMTAAALTDARNAATKSIYVADMLAASMTSTLLARSAEIIQQLINETAPNQPLVDCRRFDVGAVPRIAS